MSEEKKDLSIPIRDGRGNFLAIGNEVVFTGVHRMNHMVGKVIGFEPGGMSVIETGNAKPKETMAKIRLVFDMTLQVPPQSPFIIDLFRIIDPDSETVLKKLLESDLVQ